MFKAIFRIFRLLKILALVVPASLGSWIFLAPPTDVERALLGITDSNSRSTPELRALRAQNIAYVYKERAARFLPTSGTQSDQAWAQAANADQADIAFELAQPEGAAGGAKFITVTPRN